MPCLALPYTVDAYDYRAVPPANYHTYSVTQLPFYFSNRLCEYSRAQFAAATFYLVNN